MILGLVGTIVIGLVAELWIIRRRHRRQQIQLELYRMVGSVIRKWP